MRKRAAAKAGHSARSGCTQDFGSIGGSFSDPRLVGKHLLRGASAAPGLGSRRAWSAVPSSAPAKQVIGSHLSPATDEPTPAIDRFRAREYPSDRHMIG